MSYKVDKIISITSHKESPSGPSEIYGVSEGGNLYKYNDRSNEWICVSFRQPLRLLEKDSDKTKEN